MAAYVIEPPQPTPLGPISALPQQQPQLGDANNKMETQTPPNYVSPFEPISGQMPFQPNGIQNPNFVPIMQTDPQINSQFVIPTCVNQPVPNVVVYPTPAVNMPPQGEVKPSPGIALGVGICACICGMFLCAIPAIVLAAIAMGTPKNEQERKDKSSMSKSSLIIGNVGILLGAVCIAILITLLFIG